jgi:hypothetical protein
MHLKKIAFSPTSSFPAAIRMGMMHLVLAVMRCTPLSEFGPIPFEIQAEQCFI